MKTFGVFRFTVYILEKGVTMLLPKSPGTILHLQVKKILQIKMRNIGMVLKEQETRKEWLCECDAKLQRV